ncbi:phosphotransferase [Amycolatopsis sp. K13G38]|uniref:Phosphotransferase n=1 Tax=Amycolatopsis acididurans TaxID=2724524 RepID=A0ABX1J2H3_9PSEU|nr:phosphotransferase [Amycolatopsis acididurans]NKQ54000.1 phosphotransferase [Amycolatopsis acididurans]
MPAANCFPPRTVDALLSPEWLTSALDPAYPGIQVTGVTPGPVVSRMSTNARFRIECAGGVPEGLSPDLCGKGYFTEQAWPARHTGRFEVSFYRDVAKPTGVRTLRSVYADIEPGTGHGVVITEDVVAQGGRFLDATSEYTPSQVADSLGELAKLHAATWGDPGLAAADWLTPRLEKHAESRGFKEIHGNFTSWIGAGVPEEVRDAERLVRAYRTLCARIAEDAGPWAVIHGDTHIGNLYLDGEGRPSLLDWQLVQRGPWYLDVGYHLASALTVEDRRACEKDLVRHYLDRLRAAGIEAPQENEAWEGIRRGVLHGFFLWGITLLVDPKITTVLQTRLGTAAADHDSYGAVGV